MSEASLLLLKIELILLTTMLLWIVYDKVKAAIEIKGHQKRWKEIYDKVARGELPKSHLGIGGTKFRLYGDERIKEHETPTNPTPKGKELM